VGKEHLKKQSFGRARSKKVSLFKQNISQLVRVLKSEESHLGFALNRQDKKSKTGNVSMHKVLIGKGKGLIGEKIILQNNSEEQLRINSYDFAEPGFAAIYLAKNNLSPHERTILIRIKRGM
jgi:hypothetical protein